MNNVDRSAAVLTKKWSIPLLLLLYNHGVLLELPYTRLRDSFGISSKVAVDTLTRLVDAGFLKRRVGLREPKRPFVFYSLTEAGRIVAEGVYRALQEVVL